MHFLSCLVLISSAVIAFSEDCRPGTCKPDQTCCPTNIPTIFGCCEYEQAVCCSDRTHCCPKDTVCDLEKGACFPKMKEFNKLENFNKLEKRLGTLDEERPSRSMVMCDDTTICTHGSTCCTNVDGSFDCCPYPNASCCPDQRHCCSQGSECDVTSQFCLAEEDGRATLSELKEPAVDIYYEA